MRLCYDSINPIDIPTSAALVAGYVDGIYGPTHSAHGQPGWDAAAWARFPNSTHVRIACFATTNDGHVLDVETGDATPGQAPHWALMRRAAGVDPTVYVNWSNWAATRQAFQQQQIAEPHYWLASYDGKAEIPAGTVAKQYANSAISGGHYDLSAVADYWPGVDRPGSTAGSEIIVPQEEVMTINQGEAIAEALLLVLMPNVSLATIKDAKGYQNWRNSIANALMDGSNADAAAVLETLRNGLPKVAVTPGPAGPSGPPGPVGPPGPPGAPLGHAHKIIDGTTGPAE